MPRNTTRERKSILEEGEGVEEGEKRGREINFFFELLLQKIKFEPRKDGLKQS